MMEYFLVSLLSVIGTLVVFGLIWMIVGIRKAKKMGKELKETVSWNQNSNDSSFDNLRSTIDVVESESRKLISETYEELNKKNYNLDVELNKKIDEIDVELNKRIDEIFDRSLKSDEEIHTMIMREVDRRFNTLYEKLYDSKALVKPAKSWTYDTFLNDCCGEVKINK